MIRVLIGESLTALKTLYPALRSLVLLNDLISQPNNQRAKGGEFREAQVDVCLVIPAFDRIAGLSKTINEDCAWDKGFSVAAEDLDIDKLITTVHAVIGLFGEGG